MNRKDALIVAALLNAALLIVLFVTSVKTEKNKEPFSTQEMIAVSKPHLREEKPLSPQKQTIPPIAKEEVDLLMKQYLPQESSKGELHPPFLADTNPLGKESIPNKIAAETKPQETTLKSAPALKEISIKKGDVLDKIAKEYRVSVEEIMRINQLSSTQLKIGQILKIPPSKPHLSEEKRYYTVRAGDSPWSIAVKHKIKVEELLRMNGLSEEKGKRLRPGERLIVYEPIK